MVKLFSLYDSKAESYSPPFIADTDADAERMFSDVISRREGLVGMHPGDYSLVRLGSFDRFAGSIVPEVPVVQVVRGFVLAARLTPSQVVE